MDASISSWSIPEREPWKLRIVVRIDPFEVDEAFYRVHEHTKPTQTQIGVDQWRWFRWSMSEKPTVRVSDECAAVLNGLVREHADLSLLLHLFGLPEDPT